MIGARRSRPLSRRSAASGTSPLVKDFCISQRPADEAVIRAKPLSSCIRDFVDNGRVKECAERATWLGNDETHYERRWKTHDIEDLKGLIGLTMHWIVAVVTTNRFMTEMPTSPSKGKKNSTR